METKLHRLTLTFRTNGTVDAVVIRKGHRRRRHEIRAIFSDYGWEQWGQPVNVLADNDCLLSRIKAILEASGFVMTNITTQHRDVFKALTSGDYSNFALLACFVNGDPAAAIVAVNRDGDNYTLTPLFISVTPGMDLHDHDGASALEPTRNK